MTRAILLVATICALTGCWNGGNFKIDLGHVSVGQQMIDLKKALEDGAMSQAEYDETKATLLLLNSGCGNVELEDA